MVTQDTYFEEIIEGEKEEHKKKKSVAFKATSTKGKRKKKNQVMMKIAKAQVWMMRRWHFYALDWQIHEEGL